METNRSSFTGKIGFILAAAGSAVGLGNIWRFPYETGNHGGAAFILIYLACVLVLGLPIMIAEFTVGRRAKASTGKAFGVLAPGTQWKWIGMLGVLAGLLILGYYSVVAGWTLEYIVASLSNGFAGKGPEDFVASFQDFSQDPFRPVLWLLAFLFLTHFVIVKGVKDGIEKSSKIMMPVFQSDISFGMVEVPISITFFILCGLCTSVMWGGIFNLAVEGLGKYTAAASGIFMMMVCGGGILPVIQGWIADMTSFMSSYWVIFGGMLYFLFYALVGSRNVNKDIPTE